MSLHKYSHTNREKRLALKANLFLFLDVSLLITLFFYTHIEKYSMKILTRLLGICVVFWLLVSNGYFIVELMKEKQADIKQMKKIEKNFYSDTFTLLDYSKVEFPLTQEGRDIISSARTLHIVPTLISTENFDKYVCSGYLWELSEKLWDTGSPYYIGMMEQNDKKPASAWQLPYSYEYKWGKILSDFSGKFNLDTQDFWQTIELKDLKNFFIEAFSEKALLWDIGFFYTDTDYLADLKKYSNYNSHIAKNMGISKFHFTVKNEDISKSHLKILEETLGCNSAVFAKMYPLLEGYKMQLAGKDVILIGQELYFLENGYLGEKVRFTYLDKLTLHDVTLAHFFQGAKVEGLFTMSCAGKFYPINILQIHPRFIEKM